MSNTILFISTMLRRCHNPFKICVHGNSMSPYIKDGDIITISPYCGEKLKCGDIILYYKFSSHLTIHRICNISIDENEKTIYYTKGDNNDKMDLYIVTENEIIGKLIKDN